jgi:hypothetical protein
MNSWSRSSQALTLMMVIGGFAGIADAEIPSGWTVMGSDQRSYEIGLDRNVSYTGRSSAYIKATVESRGNTTLAQRFRADLYRGKRVRLSAYVRSLDVKGWAGLWMRIDGERPPDLTNPPMLAFDNMFNRSIKGTTDWTRYEVVLNVSEAAQRIYFGVILTGLGTVWSDNFEFGVVDASVSVTATNSQIDRLPKQPINLDFEER